MSYSHIKLKGTIIDIFICLTITLENVEWSLPSPCLHYIDNTLYSFEYFSFKMKLFMDRETNSF